MQCKNHFLNALMSKELFKDTTGSNYAPHKADRALANGYLYNGLMQSSVQIQELFYINYVIKQTMLEQDAVFKDQLLALHRLYLKQKDIMAEYRRKQSHEHCTLLDKPIQNPIRSEISVDDDSQMMLNIPRMPFSSPSVTVPGIIQPSSCHVEVNNLKTYQTLSQHKGKKMMFDLSLPASHYIDTDEIKLAEKEEVCDVPEVANYPMYKVSKVVLPANEGKLLDRSGEVNHVSNKFAGLFDLNEPFQPDEVDIPNGSFHYSFCNTSTRSDLEKKEKEENQVELQTGNDDSGKNESAWNSLVQGDGSNKLPILSRSSHVEPNHAPELPMPFLFDPSERARYGKENPTTEASDIKHHVVPYNPNLGSSSASHRKKYVHNVKRIPIAIQALPCFTSLAPKKSSKSVVVGSSSKRDGEKTTFHKTMKCKSSLKESSGNSNKMVLTSRECKTSSRIAAPIDLEAPISPENEESCRPRGESTDKEVEVLANGDSSKEQAKLAAEAIMSISYSEIQRCLKSAICDSSVAITADSLYLFASVASSMACGSEKLIHNSGDEQLDYFEMMTLKIPETELEECRFHKKEQKEGKFGTSLMHKTPRKGRPSKGKRLKDFQKEILPSIGSLSRQEVTEDFQIIEKLMNGAGSSKKKTGLAEVGGRSRRKRKSCVSALNSNEINLCNELKLLEKNGEMGIGKNSLAWWGKVTRRRRGQRFPATNLPLISTQV